MLKKINTNISKKEFLKHAVEYECPKQYGLKDFSVNFKCNEKCKECWEKAITNIRFKKQ